MENKKRLIWDEDVQRRLVDLAVKRGNVAIPLHRITNILFNESQTVDAVEVVHAQWVLADDDRLICNHCKSVKVAYEQLCYLRSTGCWNYCPNCGAHMDGGKDGK